MPAGAKASPPAGTVIGPASPSKAAAESASDPPPSPSQPGSAPSESHPSPPPAKRQAVSMNGKSACLKQVPPDSAAAAAVKDTDGNTSTNHQAASSSGPTATSPESGFQQAFPSNWPADGQENGCNGTHPQPLEPQVGQQQQQQQQMQEQQSKVENGDITNVDKDKDVWTEEADVDCILQRLVGRIKRLVNAAPPKTLLLLTTCQGNTAECRWVQVRS